ncbi:MAG: glycogen debranching protein [Desulfobacteraceae bacterium]|nr:MAG: glycogen debranching protein [Desulfobacteraceae bacterium]
METLALWAQNPAPGIHILMFKGDTQTFILTLPAPTKGSAWLRTNLGHAGTSRGEIIREVLCDEPPLGRDWFDLPMKKINETTFRITVPLFEVGHFEAKCFFLKEGGINPVWPEGSNTIINVKPAGTCCANIIYNAFVRQFGPNKDGRGITNQTEEKWIQNLDGKGYTVIPKSGTFRDLTRELDFIIGRLGVRGIQILPINPTPTTYARMGRFGSPFAALGFTSVDPALAEFDTRATPLEQFIELVDAVHERSAKIFIDIAINHTGWGASLHETHPEWLVRDNEGRIEVPGAWGVRWEDLTMLNYSKKDLWKYMADVFLTWCRRGVDGFRCDAGYMIPIPAWKFIISSVREQFPDTIFFLEGLGGKISVTRDLLNTGNFDWAYSELFQNYDRSQIENYLPGAIAISGEDGILVNFAETHDNNRLASRSKMYAMMRTALSALSSAEGSFGFANGVEWFASEKIDVHGASSLNWGAKENQVELLARLSDILKNHPAFSDKTALNLIGQGTGNHLVLLRHHIPTGKKLLIVINLDDNNKTMVSWDDKKAGMGQAAYFDLITSNRIKIESSGSISSCLLDPGRVLCLSAEEQDLDLVKINAGNNFIPPEKVMKRKLRAKAIEVIRLYSGYNDIGELDVDKEADLLFDNPVEFCRSRNPFTGETRVIIWRWPKDLKREVMVPPDHFLMVVADKPFLSRIINQDFVLSQEEGLPCRDGSFFALFYPIQTPAEHQRLSLNLTVYDKGRTKHADAPVLFLSGHENTRVKRSFARPELLENSITFMDTNGRGAMLHIPVSWCTLNSKYDALLAANINSEYPVDRLIVFTRCRAWIVFQGFSQDICIDCLDSFRLDNKAGGVWHYRIPTGQGEHILFDIMLRMVAGENAIRLIFQRLPDGNNDRCLSDNKEVQLILRPDIEYRNFHDTTKAYMGPEHSWPKALTAQANGFIFAPQGGNGLSVNLSKGNFISESEWQYMVHRPLEAERGLDPDSDLFSPGYFYTFLKGNEEAVLSACVGNAKEKNMISSAAPATEPDTSRKKPSSSWKIEDALTCALDHYITERGPYKSIIAGYPWFLDWGRDSLIFTRGLIAAGKNKEAALVVKHFARFEKDGTIPNMMIGLDAGNRDTSDAPLWLFAACSDLTRAEGSDAFLDLKAEGRMIRDILVSIATKLISGTPNGMYMDSDSGLIFSPAHFTWMDTNYPACTPREGYPVEIQALWYNALSFISETDPCDKTDKWKALAGKVQKSIYNLFSIEQGYLADCLYARPGVPAHRAEPDDALRPNQLLAITFGAVTDYCLCRKILSACEELLVPGAIRSLADRSVHRPLEIKYSGSVLNDPFNPYHGTYAGDEDTARKPAYHNGTAWTWLFPSFCEAWVEVYGPGSKDTALSLLSSAVGIINYGCTGHLPEILDGDYPHKTRGCDAQAWGASEMLRVRTKLLKVKQKISTLSSRTP